MKNKQKIVFLTTGGTIDKIYDERLEKLLNRETLLREQLLSKLRYEYLDLEVHQIMQRDSSEFTDKDRLFIFNEAMAMMKKHKAPLVILHGTDTVHLTAALFHDTIKNSPELQEIFLQPIIFTGAMRPVGVIGSDALQNVTESIFSAQHVPKGIYLCFHGRIYIGPHFSKNREKATFEGEDFNFLQHFSS